MYYGSLILILHHSILASLLFLIWGELKKIKFTLEITLIKNLNKSSFLISSIIFVVLVINISFPISLPFYAEFTLFIGFYSVYPIIILILVIVIILTTIYSFWFFNYIIFTEDVILFN